MLTVGEILQGRYRILREIGAGGMGTVYEGENLRIRRRVAIKVMRSTEEPNAELIARFEREAQIASQIPSDHITEVLDLGELDNGQHFIVMEFLAGESLAERLERSGRLEPRVLVGLVRQVLAGLAAAHAAGVIHRDIKPDNVFILGEKAGQNDFVKLLDFGVSKLRRAGNDVQLTQTGAVVGTPSYMAPEQIGGAEASPLWDLYAVGVLLYRGLTGDVPYKSLQLNDLVYKISLGRFTPPRERVPDIDPVLDALVCKAMSRSTERFQSAEEFMAALDRWLGRTGSRIPAQSARQTFDGVGSVTPGAPGGPVGPEAPTPPQASAPEPHLSTAVLSETNRRRRRRLLPWLAVPLALGSVGLALVLSSGGDHGAAVRPDVDVYAARPAAAVEPLPPANATAPAASTPAPSAAPTTHDEPAGAKASEAASVEAAKAEPADTKRAPSKPTAEATKPASADDKARKPDRRTRNEKKRSAEGSTRPTTNEREPASKDAKDSEERPDWGY